jgi:Bacterial regulatory proteins, tetR family/Tetracyclin repressor-like, C-terminal domain
VYDCRVTDTEARINPRVERTRANVLAVARQLLVERGPIDLTFSAVSHRSGVTRQTLYRHWPNRAALLVDVVLTGKPVGYPRPGADPRTVVIGFLSSVRAGLAEGSTGSAVLAIAAQADRDPDSAAALQAIIEDRRAALNLLLDGTGHQVSPDEFAGLCGPVLYRQLLAHGTVTDALIERTVDAWSWWS